MADALTISNVDMLAGEAETAYTIPDRTIDIRFRASGGPLQVASESAGDVFGIADGVTLAIEGRSGGHILYFNGVDVAEGTDSEDVDLQIFCITGLLT